jgi:hypothetical protein
VGAVRLKRSARHVHQRVHSRDGAGLATNSITCYRAPQAGTRLGRAHCTLERRSSCLELATTQRRALRRAVPRAAAATSLRRSCSANALQGDSSC